MDINTLRQSRNQDFSQISSAFESIANPGQQSKNNYEDDRIWKPTPDKAGNATATIRFLPKHPDDELPWVKVFSHGFQGPGGRWYIENSLTTLGESDPVGELNSKLWNSGVEANKEIARKQKRRLHFYSNVLVISDPANPENEGKVMIFRFGKKIFDKIMDKAKPTFEDEKPVNVFDLWEGANFKLRMKKVEGYPNYDSSSFSDPAPVAPSDEAILEIVNKQYRLAEFLDRKNFKSYEELKTKLDQVLSGEGGVAASASDLVQEDIPSQPAPEYRAAPAPEPVAAPSPEPSLSSDDDDDVMSYFQKIADQD
ncbi:MAG: single-stranded DNA-binding protein [Minisyncoccia bacterium]